MHALCIVGRVVDAARIRQPAKCLLRNAWREERARNPSEFFAPTKHRVVVSGLRVERVRARLSKFAAERLAGLGKVREPLSEVRCGVGFEK